MTLMDTVIVRNSMDLKDIERSIIKKYKSKIFGRFLKGVKEFNMVEDGDKIAVCISGGKDSFLLAKCMQELQKHSKYTFDLIFLVMNPGYEKRNLDLIKENLNKLGINALIFNSNIFDDIKNTDSMCYLCARKRRGFLYAKAQELGCNKIALGHHFDDAIETILLNIIYAGEYKAMMPKLKSTNFSNMELIRPLYYVKEEDIISWKKYCNLSFLDCACTISKKQVGKRREIKELIANLRKIDKNIDIHILRSSYNVNLDAIIGYKTKDKKIFFTDNY